MGELHVEREQRVTPLELFFDLVFVFAFTQVTTVIADDPTWSGLGHGLLILAALWWAWAAYAWLTNTVDTEVGAVWGAMLVAMAAMFVAALAVPDAFGPHGVVFGVAFLIVNVMHLALYALEARDDRDLRATILRIAPSALAGAGLIIVAGFADGGLKPVLWVARSPWVTSGRWSSGWAAGASARALRRAPRADHDHRDRRVPDRDRPRRAGHRARHRSHGRRHAGPRVVIPFWLAYFDFFPIRAEQMLERPERRERIKLARDVFSYLHLPMVAGIVLFAFAMKKTLAHVDAELDTIPALGLCGGPALYLFAYVGIRAPGDAQSAAAAWSLRSRVRCSGRSPSSCRRSSRSRS